MADTVENIINRALISIGSQPISSINDVNDRAIMARALWECVLTSTLRAANWAFALVPATETTTAPAILVPDTTTPPFDYVAAYYLPADNLRVAEVVALYSSGGTKGKAPRLDQNSYKVANNRLYIAVTGISPGIWYVAYNDWTKDPAHWDSNFVDAMVAAMAYEMCYKVTSKLELALAAKRIYDEKIREAVAFNDLESPMSVVEDNEMDSARMR